MKSTLISLRNQTFRGANNFFNSPTCSGGGQKWDQRKGRNFQKDKSKEIYETVQNLIPILLKDGMTKFFIRQAVAKVNTAFIAVETLRFRMNEIVSKLLEYPVVLAMKSVAPTLRLQLMEEIGDITYFNHKGPLTAFADVALEQTSSYAFTIVALVVLLFVPFFHPI